MVDIPLCDVERKEGIANYRMDRKLASGVKA